MTTHGNPDNLLHVFATFMGMPPDSDTPPVCGAQLTSAYNGRNKPRCAACERILAAHRATQARLARLKGLRP